MDKKVVFVSPYLRYRILLDSQDAIYDLKGRLVQRPLIKVAEFQPRDSRLSYYETSDEKIIDKLQQLPSFGKDFWIEEVKEKEEKKQSDEINIEAINIYKCKKCGMEFKNENARYAYISHYRFCDKLMKKNKKGEEK